MINRTNTDTLILLRIFRNMFYYFWMIMWMKNVNNFQIEKVQSQDNASYFLDFFDNFSLALLIKVLFIKKRVYMAQGSSSNFAPNIKQF